MKERTALIHKGLRALIERESARRLARLGGSEPQLQPIPRRRSNPERMRFYDQVIMDLRGKVREVRIGCKLTRDEMNER